MSNEALKNIQGLELTLMVVSGVGAVFEQLRAE